MDSWTERESLSSDAMIFTLGGIDYGKFWTVDYSTCVRCDIYRSRCTKIIWLVWWWRCKRNRTIFRIHWDQTRSCHGPFGRVVRVRWWLVVRSWYGYTFSRSFDHWSDVDGHHQSACRQWFLVFKWRCGI